MRRALLKRTMLGLFVRGALTVSGSAEVEMRGRKQITVGLLFVAMQLDRVSDAVQPE